MGTMGIMCAALGFDCSDCHEGAVPLQKVDWAADGKGHGPAEARMMTAVNRDNFAGRQVVTCGPATTAAIVRIMLQCYHGPASQEMDGRSDPRCPVSLQPIRFWINTSE